MTEQVHPDDLRRRARSWERVTALGLEQNPRLPYLDEGLVLRPVGELVTRAQALGAVLHPLAGDEWVSPRAAVDRHDLWGALTADERHFVEVDGDVDESFFDHLLGSLFGLVRLHWVLGWAPEVMWKVPSGYQHMVFETYERPEVWRARVALRPLEEIVDELDFHYTLHWASRNAHFQGDEAALKRAASFVEPWQIGPARTALEWALSDVAWDEVSLDT